LKVCANHLITSDMKLQPNIGSDRSWVWKVSADISDGEPQAETLAIRFANSENANLFKAKFEEGQKINASSHAPATSEPAKEVATEEKKEEVKEEEVKKEEEAKPEEEKPASSDPAPITHDPAGAEGSVEPASTETNTEAATGGEDAADELAKKTEDLKVEEEAKTEE